MDAEKLKVSVATPQQGKNNVDNVEIQESEGLKLDQIWQIRNNHDDEFYMITSHVEPRLKQRIQKGAIC